MNKISHLKQKYANQLFWFIWNAKTSFKQASPSWGQTA